jgi:AraC family transcriptional regulator
MPPRPAQTNLYLQRINAVIGYVREQLQTDISLNTLARVAGFSPFHFHRLFKAITGETISDMVLRLRLERSVLLLRSTPTCSITEAAFAAGFQSVAVFSRSFKKQYGINASQWDRQSPLENSKNGQTFAGLPRYTLANLSDLANHDNLEVRIRSLPAQRLAYIRVYDAYRQWSQVKEAYAHLIAWYNQHGGHPEQTTLYGMSQDDPDITPLHLCRFDWCLRVPEHWRADGAMNITDLPACHVATIRCLGDIAQEDRAFQYLFRYWLPHSRYQPANLPAMEIYRRQPAELGWESYDFDCAVPIELLSL